MTVISKELRQAREYESLREAAVPPEDRPLIHVTPAAGWLNDPNGFSYYQGAFHIFYQSYPYATAWGPAHWGHCRSLDLLRWERLPAALAPDQAYDSFGCFSGSAVTDGGRHLLMYTGCRREDGKEFQVQCLAVGDGVNYEKYPANPVIGPDLLPPGGSVNDFRDPKLWRENGRWFAVVGNRTEDGSGAALLFSAEDPAHWRFETVLDRSRNRWGRMWECPDFFPLDGQQVLLVSPQELEAPGPAFHNGAETLCILGDWDGKVFTRKSVQPVDQGLDFYAPQTLLTPDGRRVMIAWMQAPAEPAAYVPRGQQWFGQLTLPRELRVLDGKLMQWPIQDLDSMQGERTALYKVLIEEKPQVLPGVFGRTMDLSLAVRPAPERTCGEFTVKFARDARYFTALTWDPINSRLTLDRTYSGFPCNIVHRRTVPVRDRHGTLDLRIILDRFSVEVFVNGGEQVLSATLYTPQEAAAVTFQAQGAAELDLIHYPLA